MALQLVHEAFFAVFFLYRLDLLTYRVRAHYYWTRGGKFDVRDDASANFLIALDGMQLFDPLPAPHGPLQLRRGEDVARALEPLRPIYDWFYLERLPALVYNTSDLLSVDDNLHPGIRDASECLRMICLSLIGEQM